jgi:membrane associated rhomboid family serine protease/Zn-finger nucleic acid-binding protein
MDELRGVAQAEFAVNRWRAASAEDPDSGLTCPACANAMHNATVQLADAEVIVDACATCRLAWLDEREPESIPQPPIARGGPPTGSTAREAAALFEVQVRREEAELRETFAPPDESWKKLVGWFGFPVEIESSRDAPSALVTWTLALLLVEAWLFSLGDPEGAFANYGFVARQPLRVHGLTALSYVFIHAGWFHLAGNVYFLAAFGRRVEARIGRGKHLALLTCAAIASATSHALLTERPDVPLVGASGAISGVIAYYAVSSPRAKLGVFFWFSGWLRLSVAAWFVVWFVLELIYGVLASDSVAHGGHLGGALCGFVLALLARQSTEPGSNR